MSGPGDLSGADASAADRIPRSGALLAWLQLFRLPNVFTALADVLAGFLFTRGGWHDLAGLPWLAAASVLLYTAGMVLNDVFDLEVDRRERPSRPLPSGRIGSRLAAAVGGCMLLAGVTCGALASVLHGDPRPVAIAAVLAGCVFGYDAIAKRTPLGAPVMGACRSLNVLLGMSLSPGAWSLAHGLVAAGLGVYICGVTLYARREAGESQRSSLAAGSGIILAGLALLAWFPSQDPLAAEYAIGLRERWYLLWILLAATIGWRCLRGILEPSGQNVRAAVKHCLLSLILLDAVIAVAACGPLPASIILLLLPPAMFLGRWIYST